MLWNVFLLSLESNKTKKEINPIYYTEHAFVYLSVLFHVKLKDLLSVLFISCVLFVVLTPKFNSSIFFYTPESPAHAIRTHLTYIFNTFGPTRILHSAILCYQCTDQTFCRLVNISDRLFSDPSPEMSLSAAVSLRSMISASCCS